MTSIEREVPLTAQRIPDATVEAAGDVAARQFGTVFSLAPVEVDLARLCQRAPQAV